MSFYNFTVYIQARDKLASKCRVRGVNDIKLCARPYLITRFYASNEIFDRKLRTFSNKLSSLSYSRVKGGEKKKNLRFEKLSRMHNDTNVKLWSNYEAFRNCKNIFFFFYRKNLMIMMMTLRKKSVFEKIFLFLFLKSY